MKRKVSSKETQFMVGKREEQMILKAEVEASHRAAVGDHVCRFVVRPKLTNLPK